MTSRRQHAARRLGAAALPRRLTKPERWILAITSLVPDSDVVRWPQRALLEGPDGRTYHTRNLKKKLRAFLRARAHLLDLGLIRRNDRGYFYAVAPIDVVERDRIIRWLNGWS